MCMNCSKTKISGSGNGYRATAPTRVTYANRISQRPSGSSGFGSPKVTAKFSGRGR